VHCAPGPAWTCVLLQEGGADLFHAKRLRNFAHNYCLLWDKVLRLLAQEELLFDDFELNDRAHPPDYCPQHVSLLQGPAREIGALS